MPAGSMSDAELDALEDQACPGAGACGGQFTANTMATVVRILGISPVGQRQRAGNRQRQGRPSRAARARSSWTCCGAVYARARSSTQTALENAIAAVAATGGSTNAVLHLLAIAREAGVPLDIDDFDRISAQRAVPRRPQAGRPLRGDRPLQGAGGIALVARRLLRAGFCTPTPIPSPAGRSAREARERDETPGQEVVRPLVEPAQADGRARHPARQSRARRRGGQGRRPRARTHRGPGARLRQRGGGVRRRAARRHPRRRRRRHPLRRTARRSGHARDARRSPRRIVGPGWATRSRSSPTDGSPARPADSWSATSRRRRRVGGPIAARARRRHDRIDVRRARCSVALSRRGHRARIAARHAPRRDTRAA